MKCYLAGGQCASGYKKASRMQMVLLLSMFVLTMPLSHAQQTEQPPLPIPGDSSQRLRLINEQLAVSARNMGDNSAADQVDYLIGAEDLIDISVSQVPELTRTVRVSAAGEISLPLLGTMKVNGLSPLGLERLLTDMLRNSYVREPQVTVFMKEFHSDPVSVMGAVKVPGIYHIQTRKSLIEILAMAQGLAEGPSRLPGRDIVITRKNPTGGSAVPTADDAGTKEAEIVEVPIKQLMESGDPQWNVPIYPGDVVKVIPAGTVYVAGDVRTPGGFPLTDFDNISVIQALSMAGGPLKTAVRKKTVIIRRDALGQRIEQKVDLTKVLAGKEQDVMLGPNDILFVPGSASKAAILRTLESTLQMATGMMIYNRPF